MGKNNVRTSEVWHPELGRRIEYFIARCQKKHGGERITLTNLAKAAGYSTGSGMMTHLVTHGTSGIKLAKLEKIADRIGAEVETLAYPGHLDETDLILTDSFFKLLKEKKSSHWDMIARLISEDVEDGIK